MFTSKSRNDFCNILKYEVWVVYVNEKVVMGEMWKFGQNFGCPTTNIYIININVSPNSLYFYIRTPTNPSELSSITGAPE